jgi:hypothetical protein
VIALLRYAILKSLRDGTLAALLLAPAVMVLAPLLGVSAFHAIRGQGTYPLELDPNMPPAATAMGISLAGAIISTLGSGLAAFWLFRREVATHTLGSLMLAARSRTIVLSAVAYAATGGIGAFLFCVLMVLLFTLHLPSEGLTILLLAACSSLLASATGVLLLTFSSDRSMLAPLGATSIFVAFLTFQLRSVPAGIAVAAVAFAGIVLFSVAAVLLERRCAT